MSSTDAGLILIVDDVPTNIDVIRETLENQGFEVAIATSGERAIQQVVQEIPDLILLDVMMPGIDGFETCQRLKSLPLIQNVPVIFMTALSDAENKVKALELGAVDYVTKPFEAREVLARVRTHLKLHRLTQKLEQEVNKHVSELQSIQIQLVKSEKMSALGNLVAGIAHEINNPIGFLNGSINNGRDYVQDLLEHLTLYKQHYPHPVTPIQAHAEDIDLEYICEDLPQLLNSMQGATDRIKSISTSLRTFSRADTEYKVSANLHEGIDSTLLMLKYRLKANEHRPAIEVIRNYGDIPLIDCFPGQLNQVFMNIIANAIDALEESNYGRNLEEIQAHPNSITITTSIADQSVKISIVDNGKGMSEEVKQKIFDHLFTTKAVGKGTGLGLAIAKQIVEETHGGKLSCQSTIGEGTEFIIEIPCKLTSVWVQGLNLKTGTKV
ncbi:MULTISPECIES: sensor histidine kinase [unclassified Tolypothrix]|uniref:sensor histidine kinase n=1 Tax=unclassified Tolypothrix TaxID=2649714 RepID=UPI0005EAA813|nr:MULTISPECIES: response regulator [unclassified Tolypothrix]BAY92897.1 two-component hybrid sensor and regulator [Microchaete diplosiphon NIES-3275]EKF02998.1 sensor histidine kinase [Tolypothrix sp. PCC 7601]MBE9082275.1 hybrid sensor histidine kinase/response regulator [Tolypothrix sp. LEGE 11397]UYD26804.1 hybrid sensor histidine kinase/response regulator [Tolypothrix sp. PCC 7712]UYD37339.1 hybrid sensor histidine kinase/response regulator [Tolypothrix sp. PCC 7601]